MKVCFIGLGSIATRHIENLDYMYGDQNLSIDVLRSGIGEPLSVEFKKKINCVYQNYNELPQDYDVIFITNPTKLHYETLKKAHDFGKHFFIEKPVFETGKEDIKSLGLRDESVYYVACPLRYTNIIQYLKKNINFASIYGIRCISSSYLPEWRPGIDYKHTYSAKRALGGGVSIDLVHEWDYIQYLLGEPQTVKSLICKKSNLEIDSDDIAVYIAEYKNKVVELHLDYFGRIPIRRIELFGKDDVIEADLLSQRIVFKRTAKILELSEDRDAYQKKELNYFFSLIDKKEKNNNTVVQACRTLQITRGEKV